MLFYDSISNYKFSCINNLINSGALCWLIDDSHYLVLLTYGHLSIIPILITK